MRFLITGGSGFIGSHHADKLIEDRAGDVIVLDRWESESIAAHRESGLLDFVQGNVTDVKLLSSLCQRADIVYHLASILGTSETIDIYDVEEVVETEHPRNSSRTEGMS